MGAWYGLNGLRPKEFECGFCSRSVASDKGYFRDGSPDPIYICPNCQHPNFYESGWTQCPAPMPGKDVASVPEIEAKLYNEARRCVSASAPTSAVLACRKLLMHIGVTQGAKEGGTFMSYVDFLADKGFVPPHGKGWVDHIRKKGNEANHEIVLMTANDANELIAFSEMLLKFIYEFPSKIPTPPPKA